MSFRASNRTPSSGCLFLWTADVSSAYPMGPPDTPTLGAEHPRYAVYQGFSLEATTGIEPV